MLLSLSEAEAQIGPSQPVINCNADASVCGALAPLGTTTANQGTAGSSPWLSFITNFPVGFNVNNLPTTYSVTGSINEMGLVSAYAPFPIQGQFATLSLTPRGDLRVDASGVVQPVSGSVTALSPLDSSVSGSLINNGDTVSLAITGYYGASVVVSGTLTGHTVGFRASFNGGITYITVPAENPASGLQSTTTTLAGSFSYIIPAGATNVQVREIGVSPSGITNIVLTATHTVPSPLNCLQVPANAIPTSLCVNGAYWADVAGVWYPYLRSTPPASSDVGYVVRQVQNATSAPFYFQLSDGTNALGSISNPLNVNLVGNTSMNDMGLVSQYAPMGTKGSYQPLSLNILGELRVVCGNDCIVDGPPIYKGTQKNTGFQVQELHDAGRTYIAITIDRAAGINSEALETMTINKAETVTTGTSYTVTTGKTLRLLTFKMSCRASTTTIVSCRGRLRTAASGIGASSPLIALLEAASNGAVAEDINVDDISFPDGLEIASGHQVAISHLETTATGTITFTLIGYEY